MKRLRNAFLAAWHCLLLLAAVLYSVSCSTTVTRVTAPDGTVTETTFRTPDAASMQAITAAALALAPRATVIDSGK